MQTDGYSWPTCSKQPRLVDCQIGIINKLDRQQQFRWQCDQLAVTKFSKSKVWDKVPEGGTLIFGDTQISLQYTLG